MMNLVVNMCPLTKLETGLQLVHEEEDKAHNYSDYSTLLSFFLPHALSVCPFVCHVRGSCQNE